MENEKKSQVSKQMCVGCGVNDDVTNGLCGQCSMWLKVRSYTRGVKALLKKIGGCNERN